jgi:hypothetical protein
VFDLTGRTVFPGLIMLHEHLVYNGNGDNELLRMMPFSAPRLFLALGVRPSAPPASTNRTRSST